MSKLGAATLCLIAICGNTAHAQDSIVPAPVSVEHPLPEGPPPVVIQAPEPQTAARGPAIVPGPVPAASADTPSKPGLELPPAKLELPPVRLDLPPGKKDSAAATPTVADGEKRYIIGSLDVLYIRVWNNANLTGPVDVRPDGMISLPLVGELKADGLTVAALKDQIKVRLSDFLNSPEVDVQVSRVNSKKFYILGAVNKPGGYALVGSTTVSEALSNAGGFRDFANQKKIYVLRGTKKFIFNYKDVIVGKHLEQDIPLENGDKIVVPE